MRVCCKINYINLRDSCTTRHRYQIFVVESNPASKNEFNPTSRIPKNSTELRQTNVDAFSAASTLFSFYLIKTIFFLYKCITPTRGDKSHHNLDQASAQSWPLIIWSQVMDCLQRKHFSSHTAQMFHNFRSQKIWYDISRQDGSLDWFSNSVQKAYQCTSRVRNMVWDTKLLLTA